MIHNSGLTAVRQASSSCQKTTDKEFDLPIVKNYVGTSTRQQTSMFLFALQSPEHFLDNDSDCIKIVIREDKL